MGELSTILDLLSRKSVQRKLLADKIEWDPQTQLLIPAGLLEVKNRKIDLTSRGKYSKELLKRFGCVFNRMKGKGNISRAKITRELAKAYKRKRIRDDIAKILEEKGFLKKENGKYKIVYNIEYVLQILEDIEKLPEKYVSLAYKATEITGIVFPPGLFYQIEKSTLPKEYKIKNRKGKIDSDKLAKIIHDLQAKQGEGFHPAGAQFYISLLEENGILKRELAEVPWYAEWVEMKDGKRVTKRELVDYVEKEVYSLP